MILFCLRAQTLHLGDLLARAGDGSASFLAIERRYSYADQAITHSAQPVWGSCCLASIWKP